MIAHSVEVTRVQAVGERYRIIVLSGDALGERAWNPGECIQVLFPGWQARAYTPFVWGGGTLAFLAYRHDGSGVGARWVSEVHAGERCQVFGPRRAVDLSAVPRPTLLFGDETSLGTAAAARFTPQGESAFESIFEVDDIDAARRALDAMEVQAKVELTRRADLARVIERFSTQRTLHGVLTGNAASIQHIYRAARSKRLKNIAYWAAGKRGLS